MRDVLRTPGVLSLFVASCVARLPMGAIGLLLVLHTQALTGSYAAGGLAAGAYALALGLSNPVLGRVHARALAYAARRPRPAPRRLRPRGGRARGRLHLRPGRHRRGHRVVVDR